MVTLALIALLQGVEATSNASRNSGCGAKAAPLEPGLIRLMAVASLPPVPIGLKSGRITSKAGR